MSINIDIVVPSYHPTTEFLGHILAIQIPESITLQYYIVLDKNDEEILPNDFMDTWKSQKNVSFIHNQHNMGASGSRNVGLEAGSGEWVVFIDDDTIPDKKLLYGYLEEIEKDGLQNQRPGYAGVVRLPASTNSFQAAVRGVGMIQFYDQALYKKTVTWAVTANMCVNRQRIGHLRFHEQFPKGGGGEDVAFGYDILKKTGSKLGCASRALTIHPWWQGRSCTRFFRWGYGDSLVYALFPEYSEFRRPNYCEVSLLIVLFFLIPAWLTKRATKHIATVLLSLLVASLCDHWYVQASRENCWSLWHAMEVMVIQTVYEMGTVLGGVWHANIYSFFRMMPDHFDGTNKAVSTSCMYAVLFYHSVVGIISIFTHPKALSKKAHTD